MDQQVTMASIQKQNYSLLFSMKGCSKYQNRKIIKFKVIVLDAFIPA